MSGALESSRNKIYLLVSVPHWWDPNRPRGTWGDLLEHNVSVIFNAGITRAGALIDERLTDVLAGMATLALRDAVQRHCSGWMAAGRSVTIFSDELALLAPEVFRPGAKGCTAALGPLLSYADWVGVTGGQPQQFGHQYDRHTSAGRDRTEWVAANS